MGRTLTTRGLQGLGREVSTSYPEFRAGLGRSQASLSAVQRDIKSLPATDIHLEKCAPQDIEEEDIGSSQGSCASFVATVSEGAAGGEAEEQPVEMQ